MHETAGGRGEGEVGDSSQKHNDDLINGWLGMNTGHGCAYLKNEPAYMGLALTRSNSATSLFTRNTPCTMYNCAYTCIRLARKFKFAFVQKIQY